MKTSKRKLSVARLTVLVLACALFAYSGFRLISYHMEDRKSLQLQQELESTGVVVLPQEESREELPEKEVSAEASAPKEQDAPAAEEETGPELAEAPPIYVDFEALQQQNEDIIAWLYCHDTAINYPVMRSEDNEDYLYKLADGSYNSHGSLFMDFRNLPDLSDFNTVIYGHSMADRTMFGGLHFYKEQSYYEEHPHMWLITPDKAYRLDIAAGVITESDSSLYSPFSSHEEMRKNLEYCVERSVFEAEIPEYEDLKGTIMLSTCSNEYNTARFVLVTVPVQAEYPAVPEAQE